LTASCGIITITITIIIYLQNRQSMSHAPSPPRTITLSVSTWNRSQLPTYFITTWFTSRKVDPLRKYPQFVTDRQLCCCPSALSTAVSTEHFPFCISCTFSWCVLCDGCSITFWRALLHSPNYACYCSDYCCCHRRFLLRPFLLPRTPSLFYLTTIVCHFPPLSRSHV